MNKSCQTQKAQLINWAAVTIRDSLLDPTSSCYLGQFVLKTCASSKEMRRFWCSSHWFSQRGGNMTHIRVLSACAYAIFSTYVKNTTGAEFKAQIWCGKSEMSRIMKENRYQLRSWSALRQHLARVGSGILTPFWQNIWEWWEPLDRICGLALLKVDLCVASPLGNPTLPQQRAHVVSGAACSVREIICVHRLQMITTEDTDRVPSLHRHNVRVIHFISLNHANTIKQWWSADSTSANSLSGPFSGLSPNFSWFLTWTIPKSPSQFCSN